MAGQRERIGQQLLTLYRSGAQSPVRLLLDQSHAGAVTRHMHYYQYLLAARRDAVAGYLASAQQLRKLEASLRDSMAELQGLQAAAEKESDALQALQTQRRQALTEMEASLQDKSQSLTQLEKDRAALQKVIEQIRQERALAEAQAQQRKAQEEAERQAAMAGAAPPPAAPPPVDKPAPASTSRYSAEDLVRLQGVSFAGRKGALPWPVHGRVKQRYGQPRQGSLNWEGIRIEAPAGTEVRAVHYGRVVYADWLRGQGMLIILDHGDGYMSLYAHNDVLLRSQGEWVQAGDVVARVGNSGGGHDAGLYFEIRRNGETTDPQPWLGRR